MDDSDLQGKSISEEKSLKDAKAQRLRRLLIKKKQKSTLGFFEELGNRHPSYSKNLLPNIPHNK